MTVVHERPKRRRKGWTIGVTPIPPERYPQYREDRDHAFISMDPKQRIAEIDAVCAKLWLRKDDPVESPRAPSEELVVAA